jgi:signal transduction histidine kinase
MTSARLLVVEDNEADRAALTRLVRSQGLPYELEFAGMLGAARALLQGRTFDVALIDYHLGDGLGLELLAELGGTPAIVVTGMGSEHVAVAALQRGAYGYIVKDLEGGYLTLLPGTIENVLARRRAEVAETERRRELEWSQAELEQARRLEATAHLAAGVAHEINTPIQYITDNLAFLRGAFETLSRLLDQYAEFVERARRGAVGAEAIEDMSQVAAEADEAELLAEIPHAILEALDGAASVAEIVRAMKEFSHPGTQEKKPVALNDAIQRTLTVSRSEWKRVAEVVTDLDPDLPLVPCLPGDVNQVILNLIVNAAHAIAPLVGDDEERKGTITVRTRRVGAFVELGVSDTGTGIPPAIQDRIFEPFFTTKEVGKGTGQGLAIARNIIVKKHGGTIAFESGVRGTTFVVRLPLGNERPVEAGALEAHDAGAL